ncbi:MAG: hypothetical protein ACKOKE_03625 [Actinomycetota bacterium]
MDLATALVEAAVGAATLTLGVPLARGDRGVRRVLGVLLALAGVAAIAHAASGLLP